MTCYARSRACTHVFPRLGPENHNQMLQRCSTYTLHLQQREQPSSIPTLSSIGSMCLRVTSRMVPAGIPSVTTQVPDVSLAGTDIVGVHDRKMLALHKCLDQFQADDRFLGKFRMLGRRERRRGGVPLTRPFCMHQNLHRNTVLRSTTTPKTQKIHNFTLLHGDLQGRGWCSSHRGWKMAESMRSSFS